MDNTDKYYNGLKCLSFHALLNMIIGHRGVGKTYFYKRWCIRDYIKNKKQFVWVRRYKQETKKLKQFFDDVAHEFPDVKLSVKGGQTDGVFMVNDEVAGYYLTLSIATTYKSTPYPEVDKIIFDEFLISKGNYHYLQDEVTAFLDLMETIFRERDNIRGAYLIANNITMANPYFLYFGIMPFNDRFYRKGQVLCENYKNELYIENKKNTRFGQLIQGTRYYDYAVENEALEDNNTFIEDRSPNSRFRFSIKYQENTVGFWIDSDEGVMYASREIDPTVTARYCLTREDQSPNMYLIKNIKNTHIGDMVYLFDNGLLRFSDQQVKNICYNILALFRK